MSEIKKASDIKHCLVLNLPFRSDRKASAEVQLDTFFNTNATNRKTIVQFVKARDTTIETKFNDGCFGRYLGHIQMVQIAINEHWSHVLICEDDLKFNDVNAFKVLLGRVLTNKTTKNWDVILCAGLNYGNHLVMPGNADAIKVSNCEAPGCYLVKESYFQTLLEHYQEGLRLLKDSFNSPNDNPYAEINNKGENVGEKFAFALYDLDMWWKKLQEKDNWYLPIPLSVVQYNNFSNINQCEELRKEEMMLVYEQERKRLPLTPNQKALKKVAKAKEIAEMLEAEAEAAKAAAAAATAAADTVSTSNSAPRRVSSKDANSTVPKVHVQKRPTNTSSSSSSSSKRPAHTPSVSSSSIKKPKLKEHTSSDEDELLLSPEEEKELKKLLKKKELLQKRKGGK